LKFIYFCTIDVIGISNTMTTAPAVPSAIPLIHKDDQHHNRKDESSPSTNPTKVGKPAPLPKPKLRLQVQDLRHSASSSFLSLFPDVASVLDAALAAIVEYLYTSPTPSNPARNAPLPPFTPAIPPTRSVTLILRDFDGVAYTTGTELDDDHKEIHLSLLYIRSTCSGNPNPLKELTGVLTHELVHCYQHTAPEGSGVPYPPGGLIEGIADFVRLKADLVPPHWKRPSSAKDRASRWDEGYQHTAFFLAWLEDVRIGKGAIGLLNDRLLRTGYIGEEEGDKDKQQTGFWKGLFGAGILELWEEYGRYLDGSSSSERKPANWQEEIVNVN
jgi:hypothetical protein